jgi:broad specificity phosphatase PhoE
MSQLAVAPPSSGIVRIGLLRHFPVDQKFPTGWRSSAELLVWRDRYDKAQVFAGDFDLGGVTWQACIASDMLRARITAGTVFRGDIEHTPLLREADFAEFPTGNLRLPVWLWKLVLRLTWVGGHRTQRRCRDDFHRRVVAVADRLTRLDRDTLVVSHAGLMAYLSAELRRRGFLGPKFRIARHAFAYVFEADLTFRANRR